MTIKPFTISVSEKDIEDLKGRLQQTRWPESFNTDDWSRGVPTAYLQKLAAQWETYDWRTHEAKLNSYPQFMTEIDGQPIHFIHVPSSDPNATPLLLNHGYPGSIVEMLPLIDTLSDKGFHLVVPSLPGFGFSNPVTEAGWDIGRTARAYAQLMKELGYDKYGVQGSDIGAGIAQQLCLVDPEHVIGAHTSTDPTAMALTGMLSMVPIEALPEAEQEQVKKWRAYAEDGKGYLALQSTRPQTIAAALTDSPVGQLSWIVEKFQEWTNPAHKLPEEAVSVDQILTNVSLYWFTRSGASAAQFLYEAAHAQQNWGAVPTVPTGSAIFNAESFMRMILDPEHKTAHWSEFTKGGHFPALEEPVLLAGDIRTFFDSL